MTANLLPVTAKQDIYILLMTIATACRHIHENELLENFMGVNISDTILKVSLI